ncbi:ParB N-terminal domain-containing protein [Natronolimnohabitans innermongolicus]|uniref:Uncharacterized protein n=1 Tax=Natronolimnohabitans innermongolicus JCM 12255 TaxID=1227499 RepID=L9X6I8_9EURY|nr:ParB N-terminal domain-containing protein [Natronolimnohabitans innermongolicus]ELY57036.1 hypothetical protein C493_09418 [Natronolimnohabitans innermongolicus JCM 12255]
MSLADQSSAPFRTLERVYAELPLEIPTAVKNAYIRRTTADDFAPFDHPPDPFATRSIDPSDVQSFTGRAYPPYHEKAAQLGTVRGGDWDRTDDVTIIDEDYRHRYELYRADRFSESVFFESMRMRFEDGVAWPETPFVRRCLELAEDGEPSWRSLTSQEAILERCDRIDELYERIERNGYRSQRALGYGSVLGVTEEILVDIGRDGELLFVNGRHRLAIAKLLGLETVPVGVLVRHREWMRHRDRCARATSVVDHPDLRDLTS